MLSLQRPYSLHCDLDLGSSPYLSSFQDDKSLGCATQPRLTIVLKTTNPGRIVREPETAHHAVVLLETFEQRFPFLLESNGPSVC